MRLLRSITDSPEVIFGAVLLGLGVFPFFWLAYRVVPMDVAWTATALWCLMPSTTCFTIGAPDLTSMAAVLIGLVVVAAGNSQDSTFWWAAVGLILGAASLCSPIFVALIPVYASLILHSKPGRLSWSNGLPLRLGGAVAFLTVLFLILDWSHISSWQNGFGQDSPHGSMHAFRLWHLCLFVLGMGIAPVAAIALQWRRLLGAPSGAWLAVTAIGTGVLASMLMPTDSQEVCAAFSPFVALAAAMALSRFRHPRSATVLTAMILLLVTVAMRMLFSEWPSPLIRHAMQVCINVF